MPFTIELPEEIERAVVERAAGCGKSPEQYLADVIRGHVSRPRTIDEILAPFRREVAESGMTEDELGDFFEEVREEIWQEQHGSPSKQK